MSPAARGLAALVRLYRWGLSPLLPPSCRFAPSCSAYALEALEVHGALRGARLALWRVLRCQPFSPGGVDPVPPRGRRRSRRAPRPGSGDTGRGSAPGPAARAAAGPAQPVSSVPLTSLPLAPEPPCCGRPSSLPLPLPPGPPPPAAPSSWSAPCSM